MKEMSADLLLSSRERRERLSLVWQRFTATRCQKSRTRLIETYRYLVDITAGRLFVTLPDGMERDDLVGSGHLGLIKAVDQFDRERGVKFETYAITLIRGAILEMLRKEDWVPRLVRDQQKWLKKATLTLHTRLGRPPTEEEIADEMGLTPAKLAKLHVDIGRASLLSLDDLRMGSDEQRLIDMIPYQGPSALESLLRRERTQQLDQAIDLLPKRERLSVLAHQEGYTFKEIGPLLGVSESRAYQLHQQGLGRLRTSLAGEI